MSRNNVSLGSIQETMLLPLWGRAFEMQKEHPMLVDTKAKSIIESIDYDFSTIEKNIDPLTRTAWIARSLYFDKEISKFQNTYSASSIINIGCGLDTTYDRVNNNRSTWYEIDLPDVIEVRKKYIQESSNRIFIAESVFGNEWYNVIKNKKNVLILFAGVLYYFEEDNIKKLLLKFKENFENISILFDYCSKKGMELTNKKVIDSGGMSKEAYLKWSIEDINELEKWNLSIKVINNMTMFEDYKKNFPAEKQIGMNIADSMKIMSLAHIEISGA